jgi:hypothetical protein
MVSSISRMRGFGIFDFQESSDKIENQTGQGTVCYTTVHDVKS